MKVAVTGHRPKKIGTYDWDSEEFRKIRETLAEKLEKLISENEAVAPDDENSGSTGMALGTDQIFASLCQGLGIPYDAYIPCMEQEKRWPEKSRQKYYRLIAGARNIIQVGKEPYDPGLMQMQTRNIRMIEDADVLIAIWNGEKFGGTWNAIQYARKCVAAGTLTRIIVVWPLGKHPGDMPVPSKTPAA